MQFRFQVGISRPTIFPCPVGFSRPFPCTRSPCCFVKYSFLSLHPISFSPPRTLSRPDLRGSQPPISFCFKPNSKCGDFLRTPILGCYSLLPPTSPLDALFFSGLCVAQSDPIPLLGPAVVSPPHLMDFFLFVKIDQAFIDLRAPPRKSPDRHF